MARTGQLTERNFATHAVASDFCKIFEQDMNYLYLLSFLLTADHATATKCFVGGLEDSGSNPRVFREWAHSWARRMVIQNAIQIMHPQAAAKETFNRGAENSKSGPAELSAVVRLPVFERFVFVMSVLERYSDRDCALLLDCSRNDVIAGRVRALQQIGSMGKIDRTAEGPADQAQELAALMLKVESVPLLATLP